MRQPGGRTRDVRACSVTTAKFPLLLIFISVVWEMAVTLRQDFLYQTKWWKQENVRSFSNHDVFVSV